MSKKIKEISIILMAYNEQDNIAEAIDRAYKVAKEIANKFEIIIAYAECSTDNTEKIIKEKMQSIQELKIVYRPKERPGYGYGLISGIKNAQYQYIFYTDSDNQFDVDEIKLLLPYLKDYDIVQGRRVDRKDSIARKMYALGYNLFIDVSFFVNFLDVDCAFKIYKKDIFKDIYIRSDSGFADAEILIKAKRKGYKIRTIPVSHLERKKGVSVTAGSFTHKWNIFKDLLKDMLKVRFNV